MAAMQAALPVDAGAYSCALALDTVCYSVWIALLLLMVRYSSKWDNATKADTSKLQAVADAAAKEVEKEKKTASAADWVFLIGISLMVSAVSQMVGAHLQNAFASVGLEVFDKGTMTTVFVTILGLVCALTPLGKLPAVEASNDTTAYKYTVESSSTAGSFPRGVKAHTSPRTVTNTVVIVPLSNIARPTDEKALLRYAPTI